MDAEDPLFVLYTSGSTEAEGVLTRPPATWFIRRLRTARFRLPRGGAYFYAADIGQITGHSYIVYGPLANGATTTMFESIPTYPNPDRYWQVTRSGRSISFTLRPQRSGQLPRRGGMAGQIRDAHLRILGSVGEPINPRLGDGIIEIPERKDVRSSIPRGKRDRRHSHYPLPGPLR